MEAVRQDSVDELEINDVALYPKDSAGSVMTVDFVSLQKDMTVADAFVKIRQDGINKETIYNCYIVDDAGILLGLVTVRKLLLSEQTVFLADLMKRHIIQVNVLDDKEDVARKFDKYDLLALPVVDEEQHLVGIVTVDDAIDVMRQEDTEDFKKMAAIMPTEQAYFRMSVWQHAFHRIPWLLLLMLPAMLSSAIIMEYEAAFVTHVALVSFLPMVMDTGGNCGSQSATLVIRGMAVGEIRLRDILRVLWKEVRIALFVGISLAVVCGIRIIVFEQDLMLALVVDISMLATVFLAKVLGCMLPMLAARLKLDPALMASPLITTLVDCCSVLIYFSVAMALLM